MKKGRPKIFRDRCYLSIKLEREDRERFLRASREQGLDGALILRRFIKAFAEDPEGWIRRLFGK